VGLKVVMGVWVLAVLALAVHLNDGFSGVMSILYLSFIGSFPSVYYANLLQKKREDKRTKKEDTKGTIYDWD